MTDEERIKKAEQASMLAFVSAVLMFMVYCGGCVTVFLALPMALWALSLARAALDDDPPELAKAYAVPARNLAVVVAIFASILILIFVAYITLYLGMFVVIFGAAATAVPPPPPMPMPIP